MSEQQPEATPTCSADTLAEERKLVEKRNKLRESNITPDDLRKDHSKKAKDMKSDLKKATTWGKRFRTFTADSETAILKDLSTLNVNMFVSEAAQGIGPCLMETKLKISEVPNLVYCMSQVHHRYEKFMPEVMQSFQKSFSMDAVTSEVHKKMDVEPCDTTRVKVAIRFMCELFLTGLFTKGKFFIGVLHNFLLAIQSKPQPPNNVPPHMTSNMMYLICLIVKTIGIEFCGPEPVMVGSTSVRIAGHRDVKKVMSEKDAKSQALDEAAIAVAVANCEARSESTVSYTTDQEKTDFCAKLVALLDQACTLCTKYKKAVEAKWRHFCESTELRGDISDENKEMLNNMIRDADRMYTLTENLATMMSVPEMVPEKIDLSKALQNSSADQNVVFNSKLADFYSVKEPENWRYFDDEERPFYEDLISIVELLPEEQLKSAPKIAVEDINSDKEVAKAAVLPESAKQQTELDYSEMEELLGKLHHCAAKEYIDKWMIDFLTEATKYYRTAGNTTSQIQQAGSFFLNCRTMLQASLRFAPSNSSEMLPFLSRVTATFNKHFPEMGAGLTSKLEGELNYAITKKTADSYMRKMRNARYLCELVKFRIAPPIRVFRMMHICLDDLENQTNIEILTCLLEYSGPFFMRGGSTRVKLQEVLKKLHEQRFKVSITSDREMALDNALSIVKNSLKPQNTRSGIKLKEVPPLIQYTNYLLFSKLTEDTFMYVRDKMRLMPWTDTQESTVLTTKVLRKAHKCSWDRIHLLAEIIADISEVHGWVAINIIDSLLEDLRQDLEIPKSRLPQKRLQDMKFIGELYNFRLMSMKVVAFVFLQLLCYFPEKPLTTDYTRIRSACTLLQTCAPYFLPKAPKAIRQQVRCILYLLFQHIHTKQKPLPLDLDYQLSETIKLVSQHLNARRFPTNEHISFPKKPADADKALAEVLGEKQCEAWFPHMYEAIKGSQDKRIFAILEDVAPAEMSEEMRNTESSNEVAGPRSRPLEAKENYAAGEEGAEDDDEDEDDEECSDYSSSSSSSSCSSSDSSDDDDDEEEQPSRRFAAPTLGPAAFGARDPRGGPGSKGGASVAVREEDKEFDDMFLAMLKESTTEAQKRSQTKNISKNMETRMNISSASVASNKAVEAEAALSLAVKASREIQPQPAAAAAREKTEQQEAEAAPPQKIAFLRRNNKDKVESRSIYIPASTEFAKHAAHIQNQHREELEDIKRRTKQMNQQQLAEESGGTVTAGRGGKAVWSNASARGRGGGRGGCGGGRGAGGTQEQQQQQQWEERPAHLGNPTEGVSALRDSWRQAPKDNKKR